MAVGGTPSVSSTYIFRRGKIIIRGMKFPPSDTQIAAADKTARSAELMAPSCLSPGLTRVLLGFV